MQFNGVGKKVWICTGEASADRYGAELALTLRELAPGLTIEGMGGAAMAEAGVTILVDSSELGVVGLVEVLRHFTTFRRIFVDLVARAARERPDVVVLIDYPGFNVRLAKRLHGLGIPVVYYVSPQVWAWGKGRIPKLARWVRKMLVIFPFEVDVYREVELETVFVGHPLVGLLRKEEAEERDDRLIALLPGSRDGEIARIATPMLEAAVAFHRAHPGYRFVVPTPRASVSQAVARHCQGLGLPESMQIDIVAGETRRWMRRATAGIAASGTVTVEAAIVGLPLVVVYRVNPVTFFLARRLVKIPFLTMVNLVAGAEVFEEFIQDAMQPPAVVSALERILPGGARRLEVERGMAEAVAALGGNWSASRRAAEAVLELLSPREG